MSWTCLSGGMRTARKAHTCTYCRCQIDKGDLYIFNFSVDDGEPYAFKSHRICHDLAQKWMYANDHYEEEGMDAEGWAEYHYAWLKAICNDLHPDNEPQATLLLMSCLNAALEALRP